jgi:ABC-2 type transport system permease protein
MKNSLVIAQRELNERLESKSFVLMAIAGPLMVLGIVYLLFIAAGATKKEYNILISDPIELLNNKIKKDSSSQLNYFFINTYIEPSDFASEKKYQSFDAVLVLNEKVLSNNHVMLFTREKLASKTLYQLHREVERRLEELKVKQFTQLSLQTFWNIKHPISMVVRDTYHPSEVGNYKLAAYTGLAFGLLIFVFIFLFGMTLLRSTNREKSGRIAEIVLSSASPRQLLLGKIIGIGCAALLQLFIWILLIGTGLMLIRTFAFPDLFDVSNMNFTAIAQNDLYANTSYNELIQLVFEQIKFGPMLIVFTLFLLLAYLFYGSLFAALGAAQGVESDGQQFLIPLMSLFFIGLWAGFFVAENPATPFSFWLEMLPFTSPVTCMVKFSQGYAPSEVWQLFASILILLSGSFFNLYFAGKLFKKGLLRYGYRLKIGQLIKWLK